MMAAPAMAELPQPVREMVEAAIATGDPAKVKTVVEIAKATNPGDTAQLEAMEASFAAKQQELAKASAAKEEARLRSAGLLQNWSGSGEVGASFASGNSDNAGASLGVELKRKGIDWSHRLRATLDYQRSNGATTRERYFLSYEPRYQIDDGLFAYGLAQYEQDRFQGFAGRYAASGGLGYTVLNGNGITLATKLGPAFRRTDYLDGSGESRLAVLAGMNFDWKITDRLKLTQDTNMVAETGSEATVIVDSANTSVNLVTGLEAKISRRLSTRLSFDLDYNSNPPQDSVSTDTLSRFTLLYGF
ncbi:DUF481 domain-containing protein [Altererythrobacter fulvus]|uniref:DUF481 domain-containing protein n=1 Tax=Caenibius fulvus TaxID=2126012 RepID=UPI003019D6EE